MVLSHVTREAAAALPADITIIAITGPEDDLDVRAAHGLTLAAAHRLQQRLGQRLRPQPLVARLRLADVETGHDGGAPGRACLACAPIELRGEHVGVLLALRQQPFGEHSERVLTAFANQAALALNYQRLRQQSSRLSGRLNTALGLDELVLESDDFAALSAAVTAEVSKLLGVEKSGVMLHDEQRNVLQLTPGSFRATDEMVASCQFPADAPETGSATVFTTGRPHVSNDAANDPALRQDFIALFNTARIMVLPLRLQGRRVGVLQVTNKPTPFDAEDLRTAEILAPRIAAIMELGRTLFRLRQQQAIERILGSLTLGIASHTPSAGLLSRTLRAIAKEIGADLIAVASLDGQATVVHVAEQRLDAAAVDRILERAHHREGSLELRAPERAGDPGRVLAYEPITAIGGRVGTVVAYRGRAEAWLDGERSALARLARLVGLSYRMEDYERQRADLHALRDRQRFSERLHDDVAQVLFVAKLKLESLGEREDLPDAARASIVGAAQLLEHGNATIRELIHTLAPDPEGEPLVRLGGIIETLEDEFGVPIQLRVDSQLGVRLRPLPRAVMEVLPRVGREAIINAIKHAEPASISVSLGFSPDGRTLRMVVSDDGIGAVPGARGFGLRTLRRVVEDHGGVLTIRSAPASGTSLSVAFPVPAELS